jgi:hypothetical protein
MGFSMPLEDVGGAPARTMTSEKKPVARAMTTVGSRCLHYDAGRLVLGL